MEVMGNVSFTHSNRVDCVMNYCLRCEQLVINHCSFIYDLYDLVNND